MFSCAQQTSLSGGDKDTLAPILMVDSNMSLVNMKQTSINLEFNENNDKIVCYPSLWFGNELQNQTNDLFLEDWTKIIV